MFRVIEQCQAYGETGESLYLWWWKIDNVCDEFANKNFKLQEDHYKYLRGRDRRGDKRQALQQSNLTGGR